MKKICTIQNSLLAIGLSLFTSSTFVSTASADDLSDLKKIDEAFQQNESKLQDLAPKCTADDLYKIKGLAQDLDLSHQRVKNLLSHRSNELSNKEQELKELRSGLEKAQIKALLSLVLVASFQLSRWTQTLLET